MNNVLFRKVRKLCYLLLLIAGITHAQTRTVTGRVIDEKGDPIPGATIQIKGTNSGTAAGADGTFKVNAADNATTLIISYVGYPRQEISIAGKTNVTVVLQANSTQLTDVVVVGYGTVRKKDLTGAVASIQAKDFNKGTFTAPDQLVQGKVAGVQIVSNSGQPGAATTVRIRGNAALTGTGQPLYVVDGVPLDGRSARPSVNVPELGNIPGGNALNFINPFDIASVDVLKDASATAIYGSRAAYGVVLITTKRGQIGEPKLDIGASVGVSNIMRRIDVLDGAQYRQALQKWDLGTTNDKGANVDALDAILRTAVTQNYNVGVSGGTENAKYRVSGGMLDQQGIVKNSDFKKYSFGLNAGFKFLRSKRLGIDVNMIANQYQENIPPISNDAGFSNSLIGQALQWNPTEALYNDDGTLNIKQGSSAVNPVAMLQVYHDKTKVTTILASVSPYFKITNDLEYRMQYSVNYSSGNRRTSVEGGINLNTFGINVNPPSGLGWANIGNTELTTQQFTHTLTYNKALTTNLHLNALIGYEYMKFQNKGAYMNGLGPAQPGGFGNYGLDITNYIQYSNAAGRVITSFADPISELQSYFGRVNLNLKDRYLLTGTLRSDGSTKFGRNNRYGYFPSFAVAWNISNESFFTKGFVTNLKLRGGWGRTGNQEFPAGGSQARNSFLPNGVLSKTSNENDDLKWQSDKQYNIGLDFSIIHDRITGAVDYFNKTTSDLLYPTVAIQPAASQSTITWKNLDGQIINKGFEVMVNASIVQGKDFSWDLGVNATFLKNNVSRMSAPIYTGQLNGQGVSGTLVEIINNGLPINGFYTRTYGGMDKDGQSIYPNGDSLSYQGNPNPTRLLGITTTLAYKKLTLTANMNGAFGHKIYNNTFNTVVNLSNLRAARNIAVAVLDAPIQEALSNRVTSSSRFIENGNYMKMANVTLSYTIGDIGNVIKGMNVYFTGQNLFVLTKFKGFDPEVNVDKSSGTPGADAKTGISTSGGVPSAGIEYQPYPSARTFTLGVNFSL
ncbi:iron complex outermembrane recepter protein [Chitinophaga costaii]|uniref:Iron complex outermembrane recepter protein n=1 Tax=Chitinophaga costaii TaxID=1335309 RepID=A0A1C4CM67_9BACT|nr:SusC/RagA family TonB-linked outer membrane protein [Chitinophaga costaii]PUZ27033.1 SusC/RagA family TonB-linked outer membrane protein [Chitinophaga costaii]SCC20142.1 iron complex outermembrane recepter protein [Chitinophaga costaii]